MGKPINKKVIYTAIFGDQCGLVPQSKIEGFDFICFTDQPNLQANPWKVVQVKPYDAADFTRSNRQIKILAHEFVGEYESSIYIDANFLIVGDMNHLFQKSLEHHNMAAFSHAQTFPDSRNCIYAEGQAIKDLHNQGLYFKDDLSTIDKHLKFLKSENYPADNGLIKGGCLVRNHNNPEVIELMEDWWYMVENYSKRDQMSFNYVAWKNNFEFATIPGDIRRGNPYIYWLGDMRKNWTNKLRKVYFKRKLGIIKIPKA